MKAKNIKRMYRLLIEHPNADKIERLNHHQGGDYFRVVVDCAEWSYSVQTVDKMLAQDEQSEERIIYRGNRLLKKEVIH